MGQKQMVEALNISGKVLLARCLLALP